MNEVVWRLFCAADSRARRIQAEAAHDAWLGELEFAMASEDNFTEPDWNALDRLWETDR